MSAVKYLMYVAMLLNVLAEDTTNSTVNTVTTERPTLQCNDYLNSTTYNMLLCSWHAVFEWPMHRYWQRTENCIVFTQPTYDEISSNRTPFTTADPLTPNPKLLATFTENDIKILLDVTDTFKVVKGFYTEVDAKEIKIRRIGEFIAVDYCNPDQEVCQSNGALLLCRSGLEPSHESSEAAARCVRVRDFHAWRINYDIRN